MTKKEIRALYKQKRAALPPDQRELLSEQIAQLVCQLPIQQYLWFHLFLPIEKQNEINTIYILKMLRQNAKRIAVPIMNPSSRTLTSIELTETSLLKPNDWGVPEPQDGIVIPSDDIQVVFVPLLACDHYGNRIGYGGGYYDRFLSECRPETLKIGLSFFPPDDDFSHLSLPTDIRLTHIVTPDKMITIC